MYEKPEKNPATVSFGLSFLKGLFVLLMETLAMFQFTQYMTQCANIIVRFIENYAKFSTNV